MFVRDSGVVHAVRGIDRLDALIPAHRSLGSRYPVVGPVSLLLLRAAATPTLRAHTSKPNGRRKVEHLVFRYDRPPIVGARRECFVFETLITAAPDGTTARFYRTSTGAEIDLILPLPGRAVWAIKVKRSSAPKLEKGFHLARADVQPARCWVVYGGAVLTTATAR
jgi:hypothetical protein